MWPAFPTADYYAPPPRQPHLNRRWSSRVGRRLALPMFRSVVQPSDRRLPLYARRIRLVSATRPARFHPCTGGGSASRYLVRRALGHATAPGLTPSRTVNRVSALWTLQARVPLVAIVRHRLAAIGWR